MKKIICFGIILLTCLTGYGQSLKFKKLKFEYVPKEVYTSKDGNELYFLKGDNPNGVQQCEYELTVYAWKRKEYEEEMKMNGINTSIYDDMRKGTFEFASKYEEFSLCPGMMTNRGEIKIGLNSHKKLSDSNIRNALNAYVVEGLFQNRKSYVTLIKGKKYIYYLFAITDEQNNIELRKILSAIKFK